MEDQQPQWETSYRAGQNFLFYPAEEVVRFISRFVRKRSGPQTFQNQMPLPDPPALLDLGCGIGRHVIFAHQLGFHAFGVDLSHAAIDLARQWAQREGIPAPADCFRVGPADRLDWPDDRFDVVISCGVLDSMCFDIARRAAAEAVRVLRTGGLFYCDLVSGDDSEHAREFAGERIVQADHERGTVQSYFNYARIGQLLHLLPLTMRQCKLVRQTDIIGGSFISRYHLVLEKTEEPRHD